MDDKYCLIPPTDEEILKFDYMDVHEAIFWTTSWPINEGQVYYPNPRNSFNPDDYGGIFKIRFYELENAIKQHKLHSIHSTAIREILFKVRPWDVLIWTLLEEHALPERLQSFFSFNQFKIHQWPRSKSALINKIIFQCIFAENPNYSEINEFIHCMNGFYKTHQNLLKGLWKNNQQAKATAYKDDFENRALKKHLEEATGFKASRGTQTSTNKLSIKHLPEIMRFKNGRVEYCITALKILVTIICEDKIQQIDPLVTLDSFMESVINYPVVSPYVKTDPEIVLKVIREICSNYVAVTKVVYL